MTTTPRLQLFDFAGNATYVQNRFNVRDRIELPGNRLNMGDGFTINGDGRSTIPGGNLTLGSIGYGGGGNVNPVQVSDLPSLDQLINRGLPSMANKLNFGSTSFGDASQQTVAGVVAPYQDFFDSFSSASDLLQGNATFTVSPKTGTGLGLEITPDGQGGVQNVSITTTDYNQLTGTPLNAGAFADRTAITQGAVRPIGEALPGFNNLDFGSNSPNQGVFVNRSPITSPEAAQNPFRVLTPTKTGGVSPVTPTVQQQPLTPGADGVRERLLALQPLDNGAKVFGPDSELTTLGARQLGTVQAGLGLDKSKNSFESNMAQLRQMVATQAMSPENMTRIVNGRLPVAPTLPSEFRQTPEALAPQPRGLETAQTAVDPNGGNGSGYMPMFQNGRGGQEGESQDQRQRQERRKPLSLTA